MEIELKNITYIKNKQTILKNINLNIKTETIIGLIGTNEIFTLAQLIALKRKPTTGKINQPKELKKQIIINQFNLEKDPTKKVQDHFNKITNNQKRIIDSLKLVTLDQTYLDKKINQLSSGEITLINLALSLAPNPKILVLIDPTKNLDPKNKNYITKLLKIMKLRYKKTIIIVTNDTDTQLQLSDQIYLIKQGKIIEKGNKYKILSNTNLLKENNIPQPKIINFSNIVKEKTNIKLTYRDDIKDLMKDIYRNIK